MLKVSACLDKSGCRRYSPHHNNHQHWHSSVPFAITAVVAVATTLANELVPFIRLILLLLLCSSSLSHPLSHETIVTRREEENESQTTAN